MKFLGYENQNPVSEDSDIQESTQAVYDHMEDIKKAQDTLLSRPHFSVRNQIYAGNVMVFILALVMVVVVVVNNDQVQKKLEFLEFVNDFSGEIQQARRYEKNYFLYGTNLNDAIENIHLAESIFIAESDRFSELLGGEQARQKILDKIGIYEKLLDRLYQGEQKKDIGIHATSFSKNIELQLRDRGKEILTSAQTMMSIEKQSLEKTLSRSRYVHMFSIIGLLIFLAINTSLLVTRIYSTLNRFAAYAKRIAQGDFRPIVPQRKFRDEFTDLAISINDMIREIDAREAILIQTHKLKAVGTLTAGVAHELNNPLNNIMLTIHMLLEDYENLSRKEIIDMLKDVAEETDRSKKIIRNLLDFARESSSKMESLNIANLVQKTIKLLENQIRFSGIVMNCQFADNLPRIQGDVQKLEQVFVNLLLNAVDASKKGGKLQVIGRLGEKGDTVKVSVIDYGHGIPKHILSSVFDPFFTTKEKGKGTGLGLSVSQGIIAKHGGTLTVSSDEGSGSCFTVIFPVIGFSSTEPVIG
ncbi:MAG: HAMP domain-containing histidine kinase [Desulfobacula sp.]|nr:HAMP domain-containing histidine kinase [Desulfobacula sp.]